MNDPRDHISHDVMTECCDAPTMEGGMCSECGEHAEARKEPEGDGDELANILKQAQVIDAAYQSAHASAVDAFERGGGGWGGGRFAPIADERFADLLNYIKRRSLSCASATQKAER